MKTPTKKLTDAARDLAGRPEHIRYARVLARRFARPYPSLADDLESAALYGLAVAARAFDPGRRVPFRSHARPWVAGELLGVLNSRRPFGYRKEALSVAPPRTVSLDNEFFGLGGDFDFGGDPYKPGPSSYADLFPADEEPVGAQLESEETILSILSPLPPHLLRVMVPVYTRPDASHAATARKVGLTPSWVCRMRAEGHAMLRDYYREAR